MKGFGDGWMDGCGTFLCWMVKLTGSVRLVLFTDGRITVKTSEFISVLFSERKYWWLSRLSIPSSVIKTTEAEPAHMIANQTPIIAADLRKSVLLFWMPPHHCWRWLEPASSCPASVPWQKGRQCSLPDSLGWWNVDSNLKRKWFTYNQYVISLWPV